MIPGLLRPLFWDINTDAFDPLAHPDYAIARVLELGDAQAVNWMRATFSEADIQRVVRTERRLSRRSATFWALVYRIPPDEVVALQARVAS